jgi:uncharacterized protein (TIGR03437 family)
MRQRNLLITAAILGVAPSLMLAQSSFPGFVPGNLVVTRSVYTGDATTVTKGQFLPPVCPSTGSCASNGGPATNSGAYPALGSTNNVWNNDAVDGSFGITSPIFIDQITPVGALLNTLAIPPGMLVTSFSSKSELAINQSADGTALTLMGYIAPANVIDVSDSNTPGMYDPTNPAGGSYFRAVAQIAPNGAIQITPTNSYSGNNGRAAVLANGLYFMVGNANNGSGTPANVIASAGVQLATPGQAATTPPTEVGNFSITQVTNPATGAPYAADKAGKDNNFRGLTVFNNTLYVTKGSGGNGIDTVYQVGAAGTLPTLANAASAPIVILPGFNTVIAKTATTGPNPFGIWFANATTLYVADEGDGTAADAATSKYAGLEKWSLVSGTWQLDYVLQNGLNLGVPYSIPNYPSSINPSTDGLRNLTGTNNGDGTVTLYAVTSTVSANGDQGADPNKLVMIIDNLANTTAAGAANEAFITLMTAPAGQVLRGVGHTPHSLAAEPQNMPVIGSAATPSLESIAPGSLAFAYGVGLSAGDPGPILGVLPDEFGGTTVSFTDASGATTLAPLIYVSPEQLSFQVPPNVATGTAQVTVTSGAGTETASNVQIAKVAPGLFTLNNSGLAAAYATRAVAGPGTLVELEPAYQPGPEGNFIPLPISLGASGDNVVLTLYGTGFDAATAATTTATVNGVSTSVLFAGSQMQYTGLDQLNLQLPHSLAGSGNVDILVTINGVQANLVQITIQ